jgi:putative ABC transport system permease protein
LFGLVPAWRRARGDPQEALSAGTRTVAGGNRARSLSNVLVAAEVGLSMVLLAASALLAGSFLKILRTEQGFRAPAVLSAEVAIPYTKYRQPEQRIAFFERVLAHVAGAPGIASAAMANTLPLQGENWVDKAAVAGDPRPLHEKPNTNVRFVSPEYFSTMGIPVRAGRAFAESDRTHKVTIISEQLAQLLWPGENPLGRRLERWANDEYEVIGVAGDVRPAAHRAPVPTMYRPHWDWPPLRAIAVARAATGPEPSAPADPRSAADALHAAIRAVDPDIPLPALRTMSEILDQSVAQQRFQMLLAGVFAGAALLLTAMGIHGVVAYAVTRRTRELGIRAAFGAGPGRLRGSILRQGMLPVGFGLAGGIAAALACNRVLAALLYETNATDPRILGGVAVFLALTALLACYVPARRATRVDPLEALRSE